MTAGLTVALLIATCLALGTLILRVLGLWKTDQTGQGPALAFAVGFAALGWMVSLLAMAQLLVPSVILGLCLLPLPGLWLLRGSYFPSPWDTEAERPWALCLLALLVVVVSLMFLGALSPPTDADSAAYHFAHPKHFLMAGGAFPIPRAVDGMPPLLVQMTYAPAYALGGETAMTLWCAVTGVVAGLLLYVVLRAYLSGPWALAGAVAFLTTPAVVFGAGSGQAEVRLALFALAGGFAAAQARGTGNVRWMILAALLAGAYAGAKYVGLVFAAVVLLAAVPWRRRGLAGRFLLFCGFAGLVALPWYGWTTWHTGDPLFPMLFTRLPWTDPALWDVAYHNDFRHQTLEQERAVPADLLWLVLYPFKATFAGAPVFESGRTGLGPLVFLLIPFTAMGIWRSRAELRGHPLLIIALIALGFYVLWYFFGVSQRVRHLVPIYPMILAATLAAAACRSDTSLFRTPLVLAVGATLLLQVGGQGLYSLNALRYVASETSRSAYLSQMVAGYPGVAWINANLDHSNRVVLMERTLTYYLDVPVYQAHLNLEKQVDVREGVRDPKQFLGQLRALDATHLLVILAAPERAVRDDAFAQMILDLEETGCAERVGSWPTARRASRTLPGLGPANRSTVAVTALASPGSCVLEGSG